MGHLRAPRSRHPTSESRLALRAAVWQNALGVLRDLIFSSAAKHGVDLALAAKFLGRLDAYLFCFCVCVLKVVNVSPVMRFFE